MTYKLLGQSEMENLLNEEFKDICDELEASEEDTLFNNDSIVDIEAE